MKLIAPIAVAALLLIEASGVIPRSSVGGPMTMALIIFAAVFALGVFEAWMARRGVAGWIVNIVVAFVGAAVAGLIAAQVMDAVLPIMQIEGSLAETRGPLLYAAEAAMMLIVLFGTWVALRAVNRIR